MNPEERIFTMNWSEVRHHSYISYLTGRFPDGRQALIGHMPEGYVLLEFNTAGDYINQQQLVIPREWDTVNKAFSYMRLTTEHCRKWIDDLGLKLGPIQIHHFFITDPVCAALQLLWDNQREVLSTPYFWETREHVAATFPRDQVEGQYLFIWDRDIHTLRRSSGAGHNGWERLITSEEILEFYPSEKIYQIQSYGVDEVTFDYDTGILPNGKQVILGFNDQSTIPEAVAVFFSADGRMLESQLRPIVIPRPNLFPAEYRRLCQEQVVAWRTELGMKSGPVRVRHFVVHDYRESPRLEVQIYTSPYPTWGYYLQFDPYVYPTPEERAEMRQRFEDWQASGRFVFWWGTRDYHMSKDGEVLST